jgi:hypothetical protein
VEKIPGGDDIDGDNKYSAAIHCRQWVAYEPHKWCTGLTARLLEIKHGQWLSWNYIVHDLVSSTIATAMKEELLLEIERQRSLDDAGLLEEDKYLAEVNLEEMATSSGERQHYWLLAIQTARIHYALRAQRESQQIVRCNTTEEEGR